MGGDVSAAEAMTILIGDNNFVDPDEGRLMASAGERIFENDPVVVAHAHLFAENVEVVTYGFSRRQLRGCDLHLLSRIDRCWLQLHAQRGCTFRLRTHSVATPGLPSDHARLALIIARRSRGRSRAIPRWVAEHPCFADITAFVLPSALPAVQPPWARIRTVTESIHRVAAEVKEKQHEPGPVLQAAWRMHWLAAGRASFAKQKC